MKAAIGILLLFSIIVSPENGYSQSADSTYLKKKTFVTQGTTFISAGVSVLGYDETLNDFYGINTLDVSLGYYILKRFALKAAIAG